MVGNSPPVLPARILALDVARPSWEHAHGADYAAMDPCYGKMDSAASLQVLG